MPLWKAGKIHLVQLVMQIQNLEKDLPSKHLWVGHIKKSHSQELGVWFCAKS